MTNKQVGFLALGVAAVVVLACVAFSVAALTEAFGSGPPYFGRTVNMDKWHDPMPILIVADSIALIVAAVLVRFGWRRVSHPSNDA